MPFISVWGSFFHVSTKGVWQVSWNSCLILGMLKCVRYSVRVVHGIHKSAESKVPVLKISFAEGYHGGPLYPKLLLLLGLALVPT